MGPSCSSVLKGPGGFHVPHVIEDAHSKHDFSDEDIREMCRDAVNRAAAFLEVVNDSEMYRGFVKVVVSRINGCFQIETLNWDNFNKGTGLVHAVEGYRQ